MKQFIRISDLVDPDDAQGRTYQQVNAARTHSIPIGTLVEIITDDKQEGARLFVVYHGRDCDMTPLYWLCYDRRDTVKHREGFMNYDWCGGFSEDSLRVIRLPEEST